jgi:succinate dehydrogenase / fumarate reductase cytochrome b subunit
MQTSAAAPVQDQAAPPRARTVAGRFLAGRLGSLFAILPLGVWTLHHLWNNLAAFDSGRAWQEAVTGHPSEASRIITAVVVLVPLLWHTVWGMARIGRSRPKVNEGFFSNLRYLVQRLSAVGLLFFLGAHLWLAWIQPRFVEGHAETFADLSREMAHHAPTLVVYILGVLGIAYHLANGIWSFCMGWGITVGKTALDWMERVALALFVIFLALGWAAVYGLYRAGA